MPSSLKPNWLRTEQSIKALGSDLNSSFWVDSIRIASYCMLTSLCVHICSMWIENVLHVHSVQAKSVPDQLQKWIWWSNINIRNVKECISDVVYRYQSVRSSSVVFAVCLSAARPCTTKLSEVQGEKCQWYNVVTGTINR